MTSAPGMKKNTAAMTQRLIEEVPLWPAAAIQRGPRTVAMLNSSTSQKPMALRSCDLELEAAGAVVMVDLCAVSGMIQDLAGDLHRSSRLASGLLPAYADRNLDDAQAGIVEVVHHHAKKDLAGRQIDLLPAGNAIAHHFFIEVGSKPELGALVGVIEPPAIAVERNHPEFQSRVVDSIRGKGHGQKVGSHGEINDVPARWRLQRLRHPPGRLGRGLDGRRRRIIGRKHPHFEDQVRYRG